MKERLRQMMDAMHHYNSEHMAAQIFGFDDTIEYDAIVFAPSITPDKLKMDTNCTVTTLREGGYYAGYLVEKDGLRIAWVKTASTDANVIDHMIICAEMKFRSMIFVGAVGALKPEIGIGEICTPTYSIAGGITHTYLKESIHDYVPFEKVTPKMDYVDRVVSMAKEEGFEIRKASVFCTPTVCLEYIHLDEIKAFDTDLIEMETAAFYLMADLIEKPAVALLPVSDNSSTGAALVGRTEEEEIRYQERRTKVLPGIILKIAREI